MEYNICISGFHGTDEMSAYSIYSEKEFKSKYRENHWLGQGIYFFRDDFDQAKAWGKQETEKRKRRKNIRNLSEAVVFAIINVNNKNFIDLNSREGLFRLRDLLKNIEKEIQSKGLKITTNKDKYKLRCMLLDLIPTDLIKVIQESFSNIKQPNIVNTTFYKLMGLKMQSTQVCVRDDSIIDKNSIEIVYPSINRGSFLKVSRKIRYD